MKTVLRILRKMHVNIFTLLMVVAAVAFSFKLMNITSDRPATTAMGTIADAQAVEPSNEEPPAMDGDSLQDTINKVAAEVNRDAPPVKEDNTEGNAKDKTANSKDATGKAAEPATSAGTPIPVQVDGGRYFSAAEVDVLQSLSKRRDELDKREQKIAAREALLSAAEQEAGKKVDEMKKLKGELEALLGKQQTMQEERINSLVRIYENMKPKEAAAIFNTLDMDILLAVISKMNERKSSPILASMTPEKARSVTIRLAEQRKLPSNKSIDGTGNIGAAAPNMAPPALPGLPE